MATISGWVTSVVHQAEQFCIFSFDLAEAHPRVSDRKVKVVAHLFGLQQVRVGMPLCLIGEWGRHPKFGRQFVTYEWHTWFRTLEDIGRFLHEGVEGFADFDVVRLIVGQFESTTYDVLSKDPAQVLALAEPGTSLYSALERAVNGWAKVLSTGRLAPLLQDKTLTPQFLHAVFAKFGLEAADVILENPYRLLAIDGFTFPQADNLAARLGVPKDDARRVEGAVLWALRAEMQNGHLCASSGGITKTFLAITDADSLMSFGSGEMYTKMLGAIDRLVERKEVVVDAGMIYLPSMHMFERESAKKLAKFLSPSKLDVDLETFLSGYEKQQRIELSDMQKEAVRKLVKNHVLVLTGLPGTGKTTLIRAFVQMFRQIKISYALMAPTGIAAKRLAALAEADAATIHRSFRYDGSSWYYGLGTKYPVDAVIVDEMSMVDQELFYRILDALHPSTLLILVGDDAQLPSVGPGNVLRELLSCPQIPNVRLTQIFRQTDTSEIVYASHKINGGSSPIPPERDPNSEFQFVNIEDEPTIASLIVDMAAKLKGRNANFQVISPKYEGAVGVHNLNEKLRERLNPSTGQREWHQGLLHCREGDRLMVIQNNYQLNIYNGDMCKLTAINRDELVIRIHGVRTDSIETMVYIPKNIASDLLRLAYAITVHKSQGSEFDTVVMPIVRSQGWMLQRNLLYTAVTRARKRVWLLGDPQAVQRAVNDAQVVQRNSSLSKAISETLLGTPPV